MKLDPSKTALLVIDIQNDFCDPEKVESSITDINNIVGKLPSLIVAIRSFGTKVVFTQYIENEKTPQNIKLKGLTGKCIEYSLGSKIYKLDPEQADLIIQKNTWGAFSSKKLRKYLKTSGIENLVITGITTQTCIISTVSGAFKEGLNVLVVSDLVSSKDRHLKYKSILLEIIGTYFGKVVTSKKLLEYFK